MITRAIDANGDWLFGKGRNDYKSGNAALAQDIKTNLLCFLGDCVFDLSKGIDWFTYLGGSKNLALLKLAIATTIINTDAAVTGIKQLSVNFDPVSRRLSLSYAVQSVYSVISDTFSFDENGLI